MVKKTMIQILKIQGQFIMILMIKKKQLLTSLRDQNNLLMNLNLFIKKKLIK